MKVRFVLGLPVLVGAIIGMFAFTGSGMADPSDLFVEDIPPHRHFIDSPSGDLVAVGPQVCDRPEMIECLRTVPPQRPPFAGAQRTELAALRRPR